MMRGQPQPHPDLQVQQAATMQTPKRWPLVQQPSNRSTSFTKDARLVNAYAERTPFGWEVEKRFGLGAPAWTTGGSGAPGQGMFNVNIGTTSNQTFAVANNTVYEVLLDHFGNPSIITLGAIVTNAFGVFGGQGRVQFCLVPASPQPYLIFGSGNRAPAYYINFVTPGVITQITDPNFPTNNYVPGFAVLDGTTYVMDNKANIWGSLGLNNPTTWDALNVIQANSVADLPVALYKQVVYIVAFKTTSIQFFYDNGNPTGSPLSPVPGAVINYGCLDANTIQELDGKLLFVTNNKASGCQVGILDNLQFSIVSTPAVERFLNLPSQAVPYFNVYNFASFVIDRAGHRLYGITNIKANISMVYDIEQKLWYQWTDSNGNYFPVVSTAIDLSNNLLAQGATTGVLYPFGPDYQYPNDNGALFPVDIYTPNFDDGVDRIKLLSQMRFNADQTSGSLLQVRSSNNDYGSWTNFRTVDLSRVRPILNDEGSFHRRAYHFRHQCNTPLRIRSVDLQMDRGIL
jgi:hypothetical protein